ncbi:heavy-metal-associated domain-containing protein [Microvirga terrestris]|uniref:Heavy-metal-associated domain-containing protein n=1 Tax=Microvirga terrestris TaxID=2791024 RepID=A0ABS0HWC8_9HYPH|nr:heavy-metal-associated domain-containing protein [Microvirga terrestris]MBF9197793.1 heavy-metal-associated domain-containing protein [Microvirga terrestris]
MHIFHVPGMNCSGCQRAVTRAVQAIDPQAQVEADLEARTIKVTSRQSEASLLNALSNGGYPAQPLAHPVA